MNLFIIELRMSVNETMSHVSVQVFSVLFFLMLITLGLGSATGLISSVVGVVCDAKRHWNKTFVTFVICLAGFGIGLIYITPVSDDKSFQKTWS